MTTTTTLDIGSFVWQRVSSGGGHDWHFPPGGMVCAIGIGVAHYVVVLVTDSKGPFVEARTRGARQARGMPTVRALTLDVDDIEPLTVSPPSLPQMHKVARQALATVGIGRGPLSDTERELLGYAATLVGYAATLMEAV